MVPLVLYRYFILQVIRLQVAISPLEFVTGSSRRPPRGWPRPPSTPRRSRQQPHQCHRRLLVKQDQHLCPDLQPEERRPRVVVRRQYRQELVPKAPLRL